VEIGPLPVQIREECGMAVKTAHDLILSAISKLTQNALALCVLLIDQPSVNAQNG
jgi:hypothetical protein